jgi:hypothetical protein
VQLPLSDPAVARTMSLVRSGSRELSPPGVALHNHISTFGPELLAPSSE